MRQPASERFPCGMPGFRKGENPKNLLLYKSQDNTGKTIKIDFFRTVGIHQSLTSNPRSIYPRKG